MARALLPISSRKTALDVPALREHCQARVAAGEAAQLVDPLLDLIESLVDRVQRLELQVARLQKAQWGRRSEKLSCAQLQLALGQAPPLVPEPEVESEAEAQTESPIAVDMDAAPAPEDFTAPAEWSVVSSIRPLSRGSRCDRLPPPSAVVRSTRVASFRRSLTGRQPQAPVDRSLPCVAGCMPVRQ